MVPPRLAKGVARHLHWRRRHGSMKGCRQPKQASNLMTQALQTKQKGSRLKPQAVFQKPQRRQAKELANECTATVKSIFTAVSERPGLTDAESDLSAPESGALPVFETGTLSPASSALGLAWHITAPPSAGHRRSLGAVPGSLHPKTPIPTRFNAHGFSF